MLDRTLAPDYHKITEVHIPEAQSEILANGLKIHKIHVPGQPVIRVEYIFRAGTFFEAPDERMLSYFAVKMLNEGTKNRTATELHEFFDKYGAFPEFMHGAENVYFTVYSLSKYLPELLPVMQEIITESVFPESELENLKNISAQSLKVNIEKTSYMASQIFRETLFGINHPYGKSLHEADIEAVTSGKLINYFQKFILNKQLEIVLSGEIDDITIQTVRKHFENYKPEITPSVSNYQPLPPTPTQEIISEKTGSLQSTIRLGKLLFNRKNPDYQKFTVLNEILGGYFGSRLMQNIREDKGYTYGIYSNLTSLRREGSFSIGTDVKREFTQATIDEIYKEIRILQQELVPEEELEKVKNYMLGSFAGGLSTPFAIADHFKSIYFDGLGYDYYHQYIDTILSVTAEELMELAQKYLQPDTMLEVVAGGK
jgi:predicted Zn-dependent peptidase